MAIIVSLTFFSFFFLLRICSALEKKMHDHFVASYLADDFPAIAVLIPNCAALWFCVILLCYKTPAEDKEIISVCSFFNVEESSASAHRSKNISRLRSKETRKKLNASSLKAKMFIHLRWARHWNVTGMGRERNWESFVRPRTAECNFEYLRVAGRAESRVKILEDEKEETENRISNKKTTSGPRRILVKLVLCSLRRRFNPFLRVSSAFE